MGRASARSRSGEGRWALLRPRGPARRRDRWIAARKGRVGVLWHWHRWRGLSLPLFKVLADDKWLSVDQWTHEEKTAMKRPDAKSDVLGMASFDLPMSKLLGKLDRLNSLLNEGCWDDSSPKGSRAIMIFLEGTLVRCLVKIETPCLKVSTTGRTLDESLSSMDVLLGAADVPWEQDQPRQGKPRKK